MILLSLPVPPSINDARTVSRGRIVETQMATDWKAYALREAKRQVKGTLGGPVIVVANIERGIAANREDLDNRVKLMFDVLTRSRTIKDDSQIVAHAVAWAPPGTRTARLAIMPAQQLSLRYHPANQTAAAGGWIFPAASDQEEAA